MITLRLRTVNRDIINVSPAGKGGVRFNLLRQERLGKDFAILHYPFDMKCQRFPRQAQCIIEGFALSHAARKIREADTEARNGMLGAEPLLLISRSDSLWYCQ